MTINEPDFPEAPITEPAREPVAVPFDGMPADPPRPAVSRTSILTNDTGRRVEVGVADGRVWVRVPRGQEYQMNSDQLDDLIGELSSLGVHIR